MNYKKIVLVLVSLFVLLTISNALYYSTNPNQMSVSPFELSMINQHSGAVSFVDKTSEEGKEILNSMYGDYTTSILQNNSSLLSTPSAAEFTLPQFEEEGVAYTLREHPALRYELWNVESPDVILLGSSIFFCGFNRETFFEKYPNKRLLDFTTGNNTPFITNYFLQHAEQLGLKLEPNTVVLYGLNRVELFDSYKNESSHDYVKETLSGNDNGGVSAELADVLKIPELRYDVIKNLKNAYNSIFRTNSVYRKEVSEQYTRDEQSFVKYIRSIAKGNTEEQQFSSERIAVLKELNEYLESKGCKLIVLKLPQSLYNDIVLNTSGQSYYDKELLKLKKKGIACMDVSDMSEYNISQLDYVWPNNVFDPEHLNVAGSKRFTDALMKNLLDSVLSTQQTKY